MTALVLTVLLAAGSAGPAPAEGLLPRKPAPQHAAPPAGGSAVAAPAAQPSPRAAAPTPAPAAARPPSVAVSPPRKPVPPRATPHAEVSSSARVVAPRHAGALFAQHTWVVLAPAAPPPPPPPPPEPTAPPLPYAFVGSYAPKGDPTVYFLSHGDRVIDAHVGDRLDGVYRFESVGDGQLVFVYLPLDVRQSLAAGVSK